MRNADQSSRQLKVAELIKQGLANVFTRKRGLHINLIKNTITITDVRVSADLRHANCYFLPFANTLDTNQIIEALEDSKHAIRQQVTEYVKLRYSPELKFFYDKGAENALEVESCLQKIK
ncbi:MAG: 30S ribosome-binding factor RbfA [Rickettsiaceae bacterium]|nr:30S ribosome-binding factor RbfA [Rickettsiaceae bacterium]